MSKEIKELKEWLRKKELPTKLGGNTRTIDANVLLNHINKHYTITKKI